MKTPEEIKKGLEMCSGMDNYAYCKKCPYSEDDCDDCDEMAQDAIAYIQQLEERVNKPVDGNTSDGYHTFNELYDHRAKLFSVIVRNYTTRCWKSKLHHDGTMYDGMFIVGIDTPNGQASYHYDVDPYWDMFKCRELERAPEWDGHTPQEAIDRISDLPNVSCLVESLFADLQHLEAAQPKWISVDERLPESESIAVGKYGDMLIGTVYFKGGMEYWCENEHEILYNVTHWMSLPEKPKEG